MWGPARSIPAILFMLVLGGWLSWYGAEGLYAAWGDRPAGRRAREARIADLKARRQPLQEELGRLMPGKLGMGLATTAPATKGAYDEWGYLLQEVMTTSVEIATVEKEMEHSREAAKDVRLYVASVLGGLVILAILAVSVVRFTGD